MQLYHTGKQDLFRVYFNDMESNNLSKVFEGDITVRNINLCYYLESTLPKEFKECKNKRVMVLNVFNDSSNISALVLLQNLSLTFAKPKSKFNLLKITDVSFKDRQSFEKWNEDKTYLYKVVKNSRKNFEVVFLNMELQDELDLSKSDGEIEKKCGVIEYIIFLFIRKVKDQINAYTT